MPEETKIVYYIGDEQTPYVIKVNISPEVVTLGDFKAAVKKPNYKFFFRSKDQDFGVVKEEITNDDSRLPLCENRIVAWLVAPDVGETSQPSVPNNNSNLGPPQRPEPFQRNGSRINDDTASTISGSTISSHRGGRMHRNRLMYNDYGSQSTLVSSEFDTTSWDSRDDMSDTFSEMTVSSRHKLRQKQRRYKKKRPRPGSDTTSTYSSSITDSSMSLNILSVTLNMEKYNFLGISIVGQTNEKGDGGIYIGSIMKGGAVAANGRVDPGDMLLQVNDVNFENMSNEDAVRVLREIVHKPGSITLTVAKCWDPNPESSYFTIPKDEPVRPIDPAAWASHIVAVQGNFPGTTPPYTTQETSSDTLASSLPESERYDMPLSVHSDMAAVVKILKMPDSGLDVKTRMWLKITIPNAFIGSDLVDWLTQKVEGLSERRDARKYASSLLKMGYIRHTVNKITFSEQCYYVFGDYNGHGMHKDMATLSLGDSNSDRDSDTLGPLPTHPGMMSTWGMPPQHPMAQSNHGYPSYSQYSTYQQSPQLSVGPRLDGVTNNGMANMAMEYPPPPSYSGIGHHSDAETLSIHSANGLKHRVHSNSSLSRQHLATFGGSGSGGGSGSDQASESRYSCRSGRSGAGSSGDKRSRSGSERGGDVNNSQLNVNRGVPFEGPLPPAPQSSHMSTIERPHSRSNYGRPLNAVPQDLSNSRQSFQKAMGNPCDYFVGVM
ncbi:segment polarity protein dishevelled homolog DVL-1-like isoform X1 [Clavelina lepadiformis]|uniref:segment polarity protein dishevelled homolog DVL-1-like isoform X1 n=1 Tax=Clavelina lepadiformis TaxID=159417 RepID=UPI004042ED7F